MGKRLNTAAYITSSCDPSLMIGRRPQRGALSTPFLPIGLVDLWHVRTV
jgi:hypothetical protein